jgi:DNA replication protein DnaC
MLIQETINKLKAMKLSGMVEELKRQINTPQYQELSFEERLGHLVEQEWLNREERRFARRLKEAKLRQRATVEEIDFHTPRNLNKSLILELSTCNWLKHKHNLIITGPTGVGKTYIACALGHRACALGYRVRYYRLPMLLSELALSKGDGSYLKLIKNLSKAQLLILDDWGLNQLNKAEALDLLEVIEERHQISSTLVVSQVPVDLWYKLIGDGTVADAILDRLVHNSYRIEMEGESMRRNYSKIPTKD